jgi:hypothetical protein
MSGSQSAPTQSEAAPQPELSDEVPGTHELDASTADAIERAIKIRKLEMSRSISFSSGRMIQTLVHKYGFSEEDAQAAVDYLKPKVEADMRDAGHGFGVTPVECSVFARLAEITAAIKAMARATPVTHTAERGLKAIVGLARKKGYTVKTTENRAFYTTEFRCEDEGYSLYMMGWHGTGKFAGGEKAILEFYDSRKGDRPVVSIGILNEQNVTPENEQKVIDRIVQYIEEQ